MKRKHPIVVMFFHHWDDPAVRQTTVNAIKTATDIYDTYGVTAHYGFVGVVLQQLFEDSPETVEKIRRMRIAIGYHGGAGHAPAGPVGHPKDTRHMSWEESVQAWWEFETHALDVKTRQPVTGKVGGYLAIQSILDIIPLPTDAKGSGQMNNPNEFVLARMGAGSCQIKAPFGKDAVILSPMHESQLFPGQRSSRAPTYYGKPSGVDAPRVADPLRWFDVLSKNLPDDRTYVIHCMTHAGFDPVGLERLIKFLASRPDGFTVTHPDPEGRQWKPENSASAFYRRSYGIESFAEVMDLGAPPIPGGILLTAAEIHKAADAVLGNSLLNTHDGDYAEPPEFIELGNRRISLAQTFQALARSLKHWLQYGDLPLQLKIPYIHGPIHYPQYDKQVSPVLPDIQFLGYTPTELPVEDVPDPEIINNQGLPPCGDYHIWMPTHTLAAGMDIITTASNLVLTHHIPGIMYVRFETEDSRGLGTKHRDIPVNPAEFSYAMAQVYRQLTQDGKPEEVALVCIKIAANTRTECVLVKPGGPYDSFIWRSGISPAEVDVAWTRVPAPDEERVLWMSLPPLGDKVKPKMGRMLSEWNLKKR